MVSDNPDQPTVEHFQMLRRQWASKAQLLMATLDALPDANSAAVQGSKELKHATFFSHERQPELRCFLTGSRLYSCLDCFHNTTFVLLGIFSVAETISLKIWARPVSWPAKCLLLVSFRGSKTSVSLAR